MKRLVGCLTNSRTLTPKIPWGSTIGLRNVLAHEYGEVLVERVWIVVHDHVPRLIQNLEPLMPSLDDGDIG